MRALRWHGKEDIRLDEIPEPMPKAGWVKIKNAWAGICGSDLHEYLAGPRNCPIQPHPITGEKLPVGCGTVAALGEGVDGVNVGDRVVIFPASDDGCFYCENEIYGACHRWGFMGYSGGGEGMQEYTCVPQKSLHFLPSNVPLEIGALVEPLAVAWHAVKLANPGPVDITLVLGAGPIGLAVIYCLRAIGVHRILVSEPSPARKQQALNAGATIVYNPHIEDAVHCSRRDGDGLGPHAVFEAAGVENSVEVAFNAVRGKGVIVEIGVFENPISIKPGIIRRKSCAWLMSCIYTRAEFQEVIDLLASGGFKNVERIITARVPLVEGKERGFDALIHTKDKHVKILLQISDNDV